MFSLIVITDRNQGIGMNDGTIPFRNSADLKNFKRLTENNIVIMGRKTWDSLPNKPLPNRINIVITTDNGTGISGFNEPATVKIFNSIQDCIIEMGKKQYKNKEKFVIGGATLYDYFMKNDLVSTFYHTKAARDYKCDVKINEPINNLYLKSFVFKNCGELFHSLNKKQLLDRQSILIGFTEWEHIRFKVSNHEEKNLLRVMTKIYEEGEVRYDRTQIGTKSIFHNDLEFDLTNNNFPLITTRAMNLRLIFEELMFFLRGQTNNQILVDKKVNVWTPNTTREFLDNAGLNHYKEGDLGATYGFLFRHQGAEYINCDTDYTGQGFDQVNEVIKLLKENPYSRRIIINLWDPRNTHKMSLPPCLFNYQFYVNFDKNGDKWLSCKMTQRSSDIALAGGWNIATGALLTYMLAHITGMKPKKLIWSVGDTHIYLNQLEEVKTQIERTPRIFPKLIIKGSIGTFNGDINRFTNKSINGDPIETAAQENSVEKKSLFDFEFSDLLLLNYNPHPSIKLKMNP